MTAKGSEFLLALKMSGYTDAAVRKMLGAAGSPADAWNNRLALIRALKLTAPAAEVNPDSALQTLAFKQMQFRTSLEPDYPPLLKQLPDPPLVLFFTGLLPAEEEFALAVVGTRTPTAYGKSATRAFSKALAKAGCVIISGFARGIDYEAHAGALEADGRTVAVLGSGLDVLYPPEHKTLYRKIAETGCVLTEFTPGTQPDRFNFPARNRVISGLSRGVFVVEAPEKSGALITAHIALDQNREVFALPGPIHSKASRGANLLIQRGGAKLVMSPADILVEFGIQAPETRPAEEKVKLSEDEAVILKQLGDRQVHIEDLAERLNRPTGWVLSQLTLMEMKGLIRKEPGMYYIRSVQAI